MSELSEYYQDLSLIYSPKWYFGTGFVQEKFNGERNYSSIHLGYLVQRWNLEDAQGNIYVFGGPGFFHHRSQSHFDEDGSFLRYGAQADFETRRIYTALIYSDRRDFDNFDQSLDDRMEASLGFAPYVAGYKELNSWVIFRTMFSEQFTRTEFIPHLRFYYRNFLWEVGMSFSGMSQINFMVRF